MKLSRQKKQVDEGFLNLPAMIDVVMLLLIFFMVTSSFNRPEQHIDAEVAASAQAVGPNFEDFEPVEVELRGNSTSERLICDGLVCQGYEQLTDVLKQRRAIADVQVVVRADDTIKFDSVVQVVDICYNANFSRVGFAVED